MSKKLVGGDYLLDLSSIEIEESEDGTTKTNITDADVLEQLTNLKRYVSNPQMAKPVWVKLKNGENDELVVARGTFANVDTGEFEICVQLNGYKLIISIEFTQVLNEDNVPIDDWYIDTNDAKYLFTSDAQNINALVNADAIDNAKPIYCHPINCSILLANGDAVDVSIFIFDNNATPYDWIRFKQWIADLEDEIGDVRILTTGRIVLSDVTYPANYLYTSKTGGTKMFIVKPSSQDVAGINLNLTSDWGTITPRVFNDGVNKIN